MELHIFLVRDYSEAKSCYNQFDKIVCVAKTVEENFNSYFDMSEKTTVIHNIVDVEKIVRLGNESQDLIVENDCFNLVSVGRLINSHKDFDRLVRVHKKLLNVEIKNKLFIVGSGEDKNKLEQLIEEINVNDSAILTGYTDNPYKYVSKSDLFVCSSYREGFSTVCTEALILGVPVVSTRISGAEELVADGCGVVTENDEEALFIALKEILSDQTKLDAYKQKADKKAKCFASNYLEFESLFDSVI